MDSIHLFPSVSLVGAHVCASHSLYNKSKGNYLLTEMVLQHFCSGQPEMCGTMIADGTVLTIRNSLVIAKAKTRCNADVRILFLYLYLLKTINQISLI